MTLASKKSREGIVYTVRDDDDDDDRDAFFALTGSRFLQITDLTPLTTNLAYKSVLDLYMDDNQLESIVRLEGSDWLDRFRLLNLRGNKLVDVSSPK